MAASSIATFEYNFTFVYHCINSWIDQKKWENPAIEWLFALQTEAPVK